MTVHSKLGPGLLESTDETCLALELRSLHLTVETQVRPPLVYRGVEIEFAYRIDLLVDGQIVVEIKAVSRLLPIHSAQLRSYLRLSGHRVGLLINFHELHLRDGIERLVNRR